MDLIGPVQAKKSEMAADSQQQERMQGEKGLQKTKLSGKYHFYMKQPLLTNSSLSQHKEHASGMSC